MLSQMADQSSELSQPGQIKRKPTKNGISVQDLGYNVIFNGGERTLEQFPELTIDIQRFEVDHDPMFKEHTKRFDRGMLLNSLTIGKGLDIQLDSDLAEH